MLRKDMQMLNFWSHDQVANFFPSTEIEQVHHVSSCRATQQVSGLENSIVGYNLDCAPKKRLGIFLREISVQPILGLGWAGLGCKDFINKQHKLQPFIQTIKPKDNFHQF